MLQRGQQIVLQGGHEPGLAAGIQTPADGAQTIAPARLGGRVFQMHQQGRDTAHDGAGIGQRARV